MIIGLIDALSEHIDEMDLVSAVSNRLDVRVL